MLSMRWPLSNLISVFGLRDSTFQLMFKLTQSPLQMEAINPKQDDHGVWGPRGQLLANPVQQPESLDDQDKDEQALNCIPNTVSYSVSYSICGACDPPPPLGRQLPYGHLSTSRKLVSPRD